MVTVQQKTKQRGLGRGLSALISETDSRPVATEQLKSPQEAQAVEGLLKVPLSSVVAGQYQPRQHFDEEKINELAKSIKSNGIMQPIVVRSSNKFAGKFEIVAGERRFRASQKAGLKEVPVLLRELTDTQALEMAIVENIQRQDLNPLEEAKGYQRLTEEFSYTQDKLAKSVGKSRSHVANLMRLLALPEAVKKYINSGEMTMGHARALLGCDEPELLAEQIIAEGLSVRQAEKLAKDAKFGPDAVSDNKADKPRQTTQKGQARGAPTNAYKDEDIVALENMLTENLGLSVSINDLGNQRGQIVIAYETLTQLDGILQKLDAN